MRGLTAGLLVLIGLLFAAPAGAAEQPVARTVDEMVAQLRTDPVLVQPVLGTGDTQGVHDMLTRLADDLDFPVFVVLAASPSELDGAEQQAEQAAAVFRQELGDGLYIVQFDEGGKYAQGFGKAAEIELNNGYLAIRAAEKSGPEEYNRTTAAFDSALLLHAVAHPGKKVSDDQLHDFMDKPWAFIATESNDYVDQMARRWVFTIAAGLAVLIAGLTLSVIAARHPFGARKAKPRSPGTVHAPGMPETALAELARAQHRFDALSPAQLGSPHAFAADEALQAARSAVDTGEELDVVGAWVLALIAGRELRRMDKPALAPYRPCIVDPLHGEARGFLRLSGSTIDAPACRACTRQQGAFLAAHTWRGDKPYLDTGSVWARTGFGALVDDLARQVLNRAGARR